ncbi:hypothetical protein RJ639_043566 [Escallonia herrerae]|uniref:RING-CH-type domain-containing protein n=1 Tax=Escallonia herrerae TaxID=1293975 RepID=A0AA89B411_9ASTE|nr:hypothetical protein RJ639_043566 [Escallonia herrerae]
MGDHFVLLVDRLLTESTLEAAIERGKPSHQLTPAENDGNSSHDCSSHSDFEDSSSPRKMVECRICQDEDEDSKMEAPCSCCGSLKVGWLSIVASQTENLHDNLFGLSNSTLVESEKFSVSLDSCAMILRI